MSILEHSIANSPEGQSFLMGMVGLEKKAQKRNQQFTEFIQWKDGNKYDAWHIHDGWVQHGNKSGKVLHHDDINISWIPSHNTSHDGSPKVDGQMVVTYHNNSLYDENIPFNVHVFDVLDIQDPYNLCDEITLRNTHVVRQAIYYSDDYHWYEPNRWEKFCNSIRDFFV